MGKRFTIIFRSNMSKLFPVMVFIPPSSSFFGGCNTFFQRILADMRENLLPQY